jgi:hypothetical protein
MPASFDSRSPYLVPGIIMPAASPYIFPEKYLDTQVTLAFHETKEESLN